MLEAACHEHNAFVTLTYRECPDGGSVEPEHVKNWLKRLRKRVAPSRFRTFYVGEYGTLTERPHYHAILFGFPTCEYGQSQYRSEQGSCCYWCDLVRDTWGKGLVSLGTVEAGSAGYICGYVTKGMTRFDDPRCDGRHPEFARMSNGGGSGKGGLGRDYIFSLANSLMKNGMSEQREIKSFGRYLNKQLEKALGVVDRPDGLLSRLRKYDIQEKESELRPLQVAAKLNGTSFKTEVLNAYEGKRVSRLARSKIFRARRSI